MTRKKTSLSDFPKLAEEWYQRGNRGLSFYDKNVKKKNIYKWRCAKGHIFPQLLQNRTRRGDGCPFCSGRYATTENNLWVNNPDLAKELHPTENKKLLKELLSDEIAPYIIINNAKLSRQLNLTKSVLNKLLEENETPILDISKLTYLFELPKHTKILATYLTPYSNNSSVSWLCSRGHEWKIAVNNRNGRNGSGCERCSKISDQTSSQEIRILAEMKQIFREAKKTRIQKMEIDIFIEKYKLGIEYDSFHYHQDKETLDRKKNKTLNKNGMQLIRFRESPLKKLSPSDIIVQEQINKKDINNFLSNILSFFKGKDLSNVNKYLKEKSFQGDKIFNEYMSYLPGPHPDKSLLTLRPDIAKEWDYDENFPLKPENFAEYSHAEVYWKCIEHGHRWGPKRISDRTTANESKCPTCQSLGFLYPQILEEWETTKNKKSPYEYSFRTHVKAHFICKDCGYPYSASISNKTKCFDSGTNGCSQCAGRLSEKNNLTEQDPNLAKEWHPRKNGTLTPSDVTRNYSKNVWWLCKNGHCFEKSVYARYKSKERKCPTCESLGFKYPEIVKKWWHPTKNKKSPFKYRSKEHTEVWWKCQKCRHIFLYKIDQFMREGRTSCKSKKSGGCKAIKTKNK